MEKPKNDAGKLTKADEKTRNDWMNNEGETFRMGAKYDENPIGEDHPLIKQGLRQMYSGDFSGLADTAQEVADTGRARLAAMMAAAADVLGRQQVPGSWAGNKHALPMLKMEWKKHITDGKFTPKYTTGEQGVKFGGTSDGGAL